MKKDDGITTKALAEIQKLPQQQATLYTSLIRRYWCPFAMSRGKCDHECSANPFCRSHLCSIVTNPVGDARSLNAVLIWRIKRQAVIAAEELAAAEHEPIERNVLGELTQENPFARLVRSLGG